jgi:hypothetical protein
MYNKWQTDLKDSIKAIEKIKYTVLPKIISGEIISIENTDNEILIMFDQFSGIDLIRHNKHGLQGIASRVQFGTAYNSFTIRYSRASGVKTEYEKRIYEIENGYFYPAFTMQSYFGNRNDLNLLSIAIIKTIDLYDIIETSDKVKTRKSDNIFKFINWHDIDGSKIKTIINQF